MFLHFHLNLNISVVADEGYYTGPERLYEDPGRQLEREERQERRERRQEEEWREAGQSQERRERQEVEEWQEVGQSQERQGRLERAERERRQERNGREKVQKNDRNLGREEEKEGKTRKPVRGEGVRSEGVQREGEKEREGVKSEGLKSEGVMWGSPSMPCIVAPLVPLLLPVWGVGWRRTSPQEDYLTTMAGVSSLLGHQGHLLTELRTNLSRDTKEEQGEEVADSSRMTSTSSISTLRRILEIEELLSFSRELEGRLEEMAKVVE